MSYYFDNNNRYQIIYPYSSNKIHIANNIKKASEKCYQELKNNNYETYIFIVHDIDHDEFFYFNIPKYKNIENNKKELDVTNKSINYEKQNKLDNTNDMLDINKELINYDKLKQNEIVTRLNNLEYELNNIKNKLRDNNTDDKKTCVIC